MLNGYRIFESCVNKHEKYFSQKSFYKAFLKSLAYLEKVIWFISKSNESILTLKDFQFIVFGSFASNYFKQVTDEFRNISDIVECEFINEFDQLETQKITRITNHFGRILNNSSHYLVRSLREINDMFTSFQTRKQ